MTMCTLLWRLTGQVKLLPMLDELCVLGLSGAQLHRALENGVSQYPKLEGRFPCVSGVRFSFEPTQPPGARIDPASITVGGAALEAEKEYAVATKAYLAQGKDGYDVFKEVLSLHSCMPACCQPPRLPATSPERGLSA